MLLPWYAGPFEGCIDYQVIALWRIVRRGNAGKKFTNKGADGLFGLATLDIFAVPEFKASIPQHLLYFYIHAVKCICQGTNAHFVIYLIFTLLLIPDRLGCISLKT